MIRKRIVGSRRIAVNKVGDLYANAISTLRLSNCVFLVSRVTVYSLKICYFESARNKILVVRLPSLSVVVPKSLRPPAVAARQILLNSQMFLPDIVSCGARSE